MRWLERHSFEDEANEIATDDTTDESGAKMSDMTAWITESGAECLQEGEGPVRVMPHEFEETGFTVELVAATEIASLRAALAAALPAMREYARKNPKHHFILDGAEQDPNGVHAWLAEFGA